MKIEIELTEDEIQRIINTSDFAMGQIHDYEYTANTGLPEEAQKNTDALRKLISELKDHIDG